MATLEDIKTRKYTNFRGVDFTGGNVPYYRSPESVNMWRNYKDDDCIQTRPGLELIGTLNAKICGMHFLTVEGSEKCLVHMNTGLYEWTNYPDKPMIISEELFTGMNPTFSKSFVWDDTLFIIDGINYLEYDGETIKEVVGTIPYTSYYRNPDGSSNLDESTDSDTVYQPVNLIQPKRINRFIGNGISKDYYLDSKGLDSANVYQMEAQIIDSNNLLTVLHEPEDFSVDREKGIVTFNTAPSDGDIVTITCSKTTNGYANRIKNCRLVADYDNRFFFSGNPNFPNMVYHCQLNDPRYFPDILQNSCGIDLAMIKAIIPGNNLLWVIKEIEQEQSSIHYLTGTYADDGSRAYQDVTGSINKGCVSTGVNFNDDVVFFSDRGLEGISTGSLYSEQILSHRSSNVDAKLLSEQRYKDIKLAEWEGYLLCLADSHIYLADSRQKFQNASNEVEYEWFYWELPNGIDYIKEYRGTLYLANSSGNVYTLTELDDDGEDIISSWATKKDDFDYPGYSKTTNKRGNVANVKKMDNDNIELYTIVDGKEKYKKTYSDEKGYFPYRIKEKKFKEIQLKFSSNKPFGLFSCTLEGFIAGYIKR